jgi:hypothetical protein
MYRHNNTIIYLIINTLKSFLTVCIFDRALCVPFAHSVVQFSNKRFNSKTKTDWSNYGEADTSIKGYEYYS